MSEKKFVPLDVTSEAYVQMLFQIYDSSSKADDRQWARKEIFKAAVYGYEAAKAAPTKEKSDDNTD